MRLTAARRTDDLLRHGGVRISAGVDVGRESLRWVASLAGRFGEYPGAGRRDRRIRRIGVAGCGLGVRAVAVSGHFGTVERMAGLAAQLAEEDAVADMHRAAALQVGQTEGLPAVAAVGGSMVGDISRGM